MPDTDKHEIPVCSSQPSPESLSPAEDKFERCVLESAHGQDQPGFRSLYSRACQCIRAARSSDPLLPMACQPLGALHCALGFEHLLPVLTDGDRCFQHFSTQPAGVSGGNDAGAMLIHPRHNSSDCSNQPLLTTCLAPASHNLSANQLLVETPSFVGDHTHGWDQMMAKLIEHYTQSSNVDVNRQAINLILGFEQLAGNYGVLKQLLSGFGIELQLLSDSSPVLVPSSSSGPRTPLKMMQAAQTALDTLIVRRWQLSKTQKAVNHYWNHNHPMPIPIGLAWTDAWLQYLAELSSTDVPLEQNQQRLALCQLINQASNFLRQRSVAVYGEPDFVLGICRLLIEIDMRPALVMCRNGSIHWKDALKGLFLDSAIDLSVPVIIGHSPQQERQALVEINPDLLVAPPPIDQNHRFPSLPPATRRVDLARPTDADTPPCTFGYLGATHIIHAMLDASI